MNAHGSNYELSMDWHRDKLDYTQKVVIKDKVKNEIIKEIVLSDSYKKEALFVRHENSPFAYFYTEPKQLKGPKGLIQILDLEALSITHEIVVDKITNTKLRQKIHSYMSVSKDGAHLLVQVGKGKRQKIINISAKTGKIIKSISLGRKKIIAQSDSDGEYMFTRIAKKSKGNILKIYTTNNLEFVKDIIFRGSFISFSYFNQYLIIKEKIFNSLEPKKNKFNLKIVNIESKKQYKDFSSSELPFAHIFNQTEYYLIGRSLTESKHLKIFKFENEVFSDISIKTIDAIPEVIEGFQENNQQILFIFGEKSVVKFNILEPQNSQKIETPFKIEGGILSKDLSKVYVNANFGAQIGLLDFDKNKFIDSDHTGSKAKKVGNVLFNLAFMAATGASTGVAVAPNFKLSSNTMMLSLNQKFLFAINNKTDDVSIFNANDLSNKKIYPTGKRTFQMIQGKNNPDLPVIIISQKKVSFFNPATGELIRQLAYDKFIKITDDQNLVYILDKKQLQMPLYNQEK